jgi:hypothetical protein
MSEDIKLPVVDFRDKKAVLNAAMPDDKDTQKQIKQELKKAKAEITIVKFTEKEISQMPKVIQRLIIIDKKRCRLRTRKSGKNSTTYQIRFRRDGYEINANGKTIELAKANFIEKAIAQGQYFPVTVPEHKKSEHKIRLHCDLWHEYNMHRKEVSDETYNELCHCIINMMEDMVKNKMLQMILDLRVL